MIGAAGKPSTLLFALGPLLRGCRYETTPVPEIRDQAAVLARRVVSAAQAHHPRPISAA